MSEFKIKVWANAGPAHREREVIDLVDDWGYDEDDAMAAIKDIDSPSGVPSEFDNAMQEYAVKMIGFEWGYEAVTDKEGA